MLRQEKPKSWVTGSISNLNNMKTNITTIKKLKKNNNEKNIKELDLNLSKLSNNSML